MPSEKELLQEVETHARALARAASFAEVCYTQYSEEIEHTLQERLTAIQGEHDRALDQIWLKHNQTMVALRQELIDVEQAAGLWALAWDNPGWDGYRPAPGAPTPVLTRLGMLQMSAGVRKPNDESLKTAALLPIVGGRNVLVKASGAAKEQAVNGMQSMVLRLLATTSPGSMRLLLIDPVGLGQNVAGFMHLTDYMDELVSGKAWTERHHIEQQLTKLSEHMEMVIQKYLRNRYATMEDYNAEAGEVAEPYRLLVVMNFPVNFTEDSARRLLSIATNGPRCGVYVLVTVDTEQPRPHGFNLADLERTATVIAGDGGRFVWQDKDFQDAILTLDDPPSMERFEHMVKAVGMAAVDASKVEVPFERICLPPEQWWQDNTGRGIRVPIGRWGAQGIQYFEVGEGTTQHALVAGRTGSGKSNFMHVLINSLAITYSPQELELYLIDFKKGVEFKPYAVHRLPHARVVAIESEREFGLSVLEGLDSQLQHRGEAFRSAGCNDLEEYRKKTGGDLPRILLIVDEFQEFFTYDDRLAAQANLLLDRLTRQGRAFGIHILLGSQTLHGAYSLARSTMDQMAVRIALQCSDADSRLILAEDNPAARWLSRPGEAYYNAASGLVEGNTLFQLAWLPDEKRESYPLLLREMAERRGLISRPPIVFEGTEPARVEQNLPLQNLLAAPSWPEHSREVWAWFGEPIAIKPPTAARFRRLGGSNLLILGRDEGAAAGMLSAALISLVAQHRPDEVRFEVIDLTTYDAQWAEAPETLADVLPHPIQVLGRRDVADLIGELHSLVKDRSEGRHRAEMPVYLFILGLHRARDLRQPGGGYFGYGTDTPPSPAQQFATILQEGPEASVHVLAWCDTYGNLTRALDRQTVAEFGMRVAMPMSAEDSNNLVDDSAAAKLGQSNRAIFYDEEQVGFLERFRPYQVPEAAWIENVGKILQQRLKVEQKQAEG